MSHAALPDSLSRFQFGYCTNVHAGLDLASIRENLDRYAVAAGERLRGTHPLDRLGVGLWIPDPASRELSGSQLESFRDFLGDRRLHAFTINGFPFGNFHGEVVKQRVYLPSWSDPARLDYTRRLADILAGLLGDAPTVGSISSLPIGWPGNPYAEQAPTAAAGREQEFEAAGRQLRQLAEDLRQLEERTGKRIVVAIEPEPGCWLDTIDDMIAFFERHLPEDQHRRHLTACHDICHSAVMNESQAEVIARYGRAGIEIGKVQVSNAIVADWSDRDPAEYAAVLEQLQAFAEDRYLHQTGQLRRDGTFALAEDLPGLIASTEPRALAEVLRWVVHFHVPIFLERFGYLTTSRQAVVECLATLADPPAGVAFTGHLEVETYAWTVLPPELRQRGLAEDIAGELGWLIDQLSMQVSRNRASR